MKKKMIFTMFIVVFFFGALQAQEVTFDWEESVWLPGRGMETVVVQDTLLFHLGGQLPYGNLYDEPRTASYLEIKFPGNQWALQNTKLHYRDYVDAHYYNGKVFVLGGSGYPVSDSTVEILDVNSLEVTYGANFPEPRSQAGSVIYQGKIYVFGGSDYDYTTQTTTYKPSLYIYDCDANSWAQGTDMPYEGVINQAAEYNGKIYAFGGYNGSTSDLIYRYDIASDTWEQIGNTPEPVSAETVVGYGENIFLIGDYAEENRFWKYNVTTATWTSYTSNLIGRRHSSAAILDDRLYVVAGVAQNNGKYRYLNVVQSTDLTQLITGVRDNEYTPVDFKLEQNYPNPFNPTTKVNFSINRNAHVKLQVYDSLGKLVKVLIDRKMSVGFHSVNFNAANLSSGVYYYQINVNDKYVQSKKMTLLK
jgi:N-acetylneuraminic acid mutarotase